MDSQRDLASQDGEIKGLQECPIQAPISLPELDFLNTDSEVMSSRRPKSSLRMKYEAEALLIRKKLGNLEEIRIQLGLSQRKVCQLLLVDPSAWTRWTRGEESAPPHVYRMLQWYLALHDKYPALDVNFWLSTVTRVEKSDSTQNEELHRKLTDLNHRMKAREGELQDSLEKLSAQVADLRDQLEKERNKKQRKKNTNPQTKKISGSFWKRLLSRGES